MASMRLKISKTKSGTYYIPSISIKQLRKLEKMNKKRWTISKDFTNIYLEAV